MKNRIEISTDTINAYANIEVNASKIGTRILIVFLLIEILLIIGLFTSIESQEIYSMIIPIILILIFFVGLPVKYLLWNLYGKEQLIVNTKSISWAYDYGFFQTNLKTVEYNILTSGFEIVRQKDGADIGRLVFYNIRKDNNLVEQIHQTTVLLTRDELREFDKQIAEIFATEFLYKNGFVPFSLN